MEQRTEQMPSGVKVLDLSNLIAGPGISTIPADFGADVIKVEHPEIGDYIRNCGHKKNSVSVAWKSHGRGERLLSLNLNLPERRKIIRRLATDSDILIASYRPKKMEEWGLDYDSFATDNPGLIMVRITGWSETGPYGDRPGFGTLAEAFSGFAHITGQKDGPPTLPGLALGDGIASLVEACSVMMALDHRDAHGRPGRVIELEGEDLGRIRMAGIPPRFSRTAGRIRHPGRLAIGHDAVEIRHAIGMSDGEVRELREKGIIKAPETATARP